MNILTIRTDNPEAELALYDDNTQVTSLLWAAHRQLAEGIHLKIQQLLATQHTQLKDLQGIVVYKGPGSFTGLRIGISVANALADGLEIPIVGESGKTWQITGCKRLQASENESIVSPEYGADPHITQQKR